MIDLTKKALPNVIKIRNKSYAIKTDFRVWLKLSIALENGQQFDFKTLFLENKPLFVCFDDIKSFLNPPKVIPKPVSNNSVQALDFILDSDFIYSSFIEKYKIDLLETEMHWHKFLALFNGLFNNINQIVSYRIYKGKDTEYNKLKNIWQLPRKTDIQTQKAKSHFDSLDKT